MTPSLRIGLAATLVCSFAAPALAQSAPAQALWVQTPSGALVPKFWPERAQRLKVDGEAVLKCEHDAAGVLELCTVVSETPTGFAFGLAALHMVHAFKLRPERSDGSPLSAGEITFAVPFRAAEFKRNW